MKTALAIAAKIENDIIAGHIENDIIAGHFEPTLDRYRLTPKTAIAPYRKSA